MCVCAHSVPVRECMHLCGQVAPQFAAHLSNDQLELCTALGHLLHSVAFLPKVLPPVEKASNDALTDKLDVS